MQPSVQTLEVMAELDLEDDSDLTLTFAATDAEIAVLDLSPRLLDAPGHLQDHVLDEGRWQRLAQATAAAAVSSTLTLPVLAGGVVGNSVDVYAGLTEADHAALVIRRQTRDEA